MLFRELFQFDDIPQSPSHMEVQSELQLSMTLLVSALSGVPAPKTMCFSGINQGVPLSILVDSGSSHTLSSKVVATLSGISALSPSVCIRVANGAVLHYVAHLPKAHWSMQECQFQTDLKIMPLPVYDMILGLYWLESFCPMQVHWKQKWMSIP